MVKVMASEGVAIALQAKVHDDVGKALTELKMMKKNILELIGQEEVAVAELDISWNKMLKAYKEKVPVKLGAASNEEKEEIVKAYRDLCKGKKELYTLKEEFLRWMKFEIAEEKLAQTAEEVKKLIAEYIDICRLLNRTFVKEMMESVTPKDVELLLQNALSWLKSSCVRLACSLDNLSIRAYQ